MNRKDNIFLIGPMGSGKTSVGKQLEKILQLPFYDSDREIEKRTGASVSWIFELEKESGFRLREAKVIDELTQLNGVILATGGGCIMTPSNCKYLSTRGIVVYLKVSIEIQALRTSFKKGQRPLLEVEDPIQKLLALNQEREPLYCALADLIFNTDEDVPIKLAHKIIEGIRQHST